MKPMPYYEVNPKQRMVIETEDGRKIEGLFTSLRISRGTIPEGKYAYDIRDSDESFDYCQVQPYVWVNHGGTIVTDVQIPEDTVWPLEIKRYHFIDMKHESGVSA